MDFWRSASSVSGRLEGARRGCERREVWARRKLVLRSIIVGVGVVIFGWARWSAGRKTRF